MYIRIYNKKLVYVYEEVDLQNSEIIGKLKGREALGFSIREAGKIIYHEVDKITAKELQLIIRNQKTVTIAIKMTSKEVFDYFYKIMEDIYLEYPDILDKDISIESMMKEKIDAGIVKSDIFHTIKPKLLAKLREKKDK